MAVSSEAAAMKFAVLADIHGNSDALEAVLRDMAAHGLETAVNLGDFSAGRSTRGKLRIF